MALRVRGLTPIKSATPGGVGLAPDPAGALEGMPRVRLTRRQVAATAFFVASMMAFLYVVLPKLVGLKGTVRRIDHGDAWWLGAGLLFEVASFAGYVALFRAVFVERSSRIGWRESYEITMAGLAATRLFAAAGAGGVALTAWALRRAGLAARIVASRMIAFLAILYGVYMLTLVVGGVGLYTGLLPGRAPFAITVVPAIFGALAIAAFLAASFVPADSERLTSSIRRSGWLGGLERRIAAAPGAASTGIRTAIALVRRRDPQLLGAVAWWGFDILVLWACFHAFGSVPPKAVIVMAYFVGMLGNTLPLPAGIGGVDGGMIGAFSAFGIPVDESVIAVLAYRLIAFWLPTLPGGIAYLTLRRTVHRWQDADATPVAS